MSNHSCTPSSRELGLSARLLRRLLLAGVGFASLTLAPPVRAQSATPQDLAAALQTVRDILAEQPELSYVEVDTMVSGAPQRYPHQIQIVDTVGDPAACTLRWTERNPLKAGRLDATWTINAAQMHNFYVNPESPDPDTSRGETAEAYDPMVYVVFMDGSETFAQRHAVKYTNGKQPDPPKDRKDNLAYIKVGSQSYGNRLGNAIQHVAVLCGAKLTTPPTEIIARAAAAAPAPAAAAAPPAPPAPAPAQAPAPAGSATTTPAGFPAPALVYFSSYVSKDTDNQKFDNGQYKHFRKAGSNDTASMIAYEGALSAMDGKNSEKSMKQNVKAAIQYLGMVDDFSAVLDPGYVGYRFLGQGAPPVPPDAAIAEKWLLLAPNDPDSIYNLGVAYLRGDLLHKDEEKGLSLVLKAATDGQPQAVLLMGELYAEGRLVPRDLTVAQGFLDAYPSMAAKQQAQMRAEATDAAAFDAHLKQMDADAHVAMLGIISDGLNNIANTISTPTAIQTARDESLANINAVAARETPQQAQDGLKNSLAKAQANAQSPFHIAPTKPAAPSTGGNSGTVAPPVAYQPPASTAGTIVATLCPASGFSGMRQTGDVAVGIPCTPGQPIGSGSSSTPAGNSGSSSGSAGGSSANGGSSTGSGAAGDFAEGLDWCVRQSFTPINPGDTDNYLTFYDGCAAPVYTMWIVGPNGTPGGHLFAAGETLNQTGIDQNDVSTHGGVTYYACPADHPVAVDPQGNQIFGPVPKYKCAKRS